ncbi:hypothetical protein HBB16_04545 [Pseudonocardia sp. MCCB 268]|nr:hypothetical protein [Pseudonocardia cytotoxica]
MKAAAAAGGALVGGPMLDPTGPPRELRWRPPHLRCGLGARWPCSGRPAAGIRRGGQSDLGLDRAYGLTSPAERPVRPLGGHHLPPRPHRDPWSWDSCGHSSGFCHDGRVSRSPEPDGCRRVRRVHCPYLRRHGGRAVQSHITRIAAADPAFARRATLLCRHVRRDRPAGPAGPCPAGRLAGPDPAERRPGAVDDHGGNHDGAGSGELWVPGILSRFTPSGHGRPDGSGHHSFRYQNVA